MMTTEHAYSPEEIMAYLDGEVSTTEQRGIEQHLAECANCRRLLEDLQGLSTELKAWNLPERLTLTAPSISQRRTWLSRNWTWLFLPASAVFVLAVIVQAPHTRPSKYVAQESVLATEPLLLKDRGKATPVLPPPPPPPPPIADSTSDASYSYDANALPEAVKAPPSAPVQKQLHAAPQPLIARTASLDIAVAHVDAARTALERMLTLRTGFAAELNVVSDENTAKTLQASLRVPSDQMDQALTDLRALGLVTHEERRGEEVSAQHQDLQVRLQNARETEARMRGILAQRTGHLSDVLEVEQEIARVREEIESMEADLRNLDHRVAYATIELTLTERSQPAARPSRLAQAWQNGRRNLRESAVSVAVFLGETGPTLLLWGLILGLPAWFGWRRYRRLRNRL